MLEQLAGFCYTACADEAVGNSEGRRGLAFFNPVFFEQLQSSLQKCCSYCAFLHTTGNIRKMFLVEYIIL